MRKEEVPTTGKESPILQTNPVSIRVFAIDKSSGEPAPGQILDLFYVNREEKEQLLGTLSSDHAGYVSFKADLPSDAKNLVVRSRDDSVRDLVISPSANFDAAWQVHVEPSKSGPSRMAGALPSLTLPDGLDATLSPASFSTVPRPYPPFGLCSQLTPTSLTKRTYTFKSVVFECGTLAMVNCGEGHGEHWIRKGKIHTYRQTWQPRGYSMGRLINSFSLAPCEKVKIGTYSKLRDLVSSNSNNVSQNQTESATNIRNATTTNAVDWSVKRGWNISLGAMIEGIGASVGFGQASVQTPKSTTTTLSENIVRNATASFDYLSTSIFELSESESGNIQTRTIGNNNHCHMLNIMYYGMNENYTVLTSYVGAQNVVFIQVPEVPITVDSIFAARNILRGNLLDPALEECLEEFEEYYCCGRTAPATGSPKLRVHVGLQFSQEADSVIVRLRLTDGTSIDKVVPLAGWAPGTEKVIDFDLIGGVDPTKVAGLDVLGNFIVRAGGSIFGRNQFIFLNTIKLEYQESASKPWVLLAQANSKQMTDNGQIGWQDDVSLSAPAVLPSSDDGCQEAKCCIETLMRHINGNREHYMVMLLSARDYGDILADWCACKIAGGVSAPMIQGMPMGVVHASNAYWLVIAEQGSVVVPDPTVPRITEEVVVPSPGIFSEALLGSCNSCERIEPGRFWKWQDAPCPDDAPNLTDVSGMSGSGIKPSDYTAITPTTLITAQSWPDPLGTASLADLAKALATSADAGSTEASANLTKVLEVLKDLGKAAVEAWNADHPKKDTPAEVPKDSPADDTGNDIPPDTQV